MFTQSCFIRKNTFELRNKLRKMGYRVPPESHIADNKRGILCRPGYAVGIPDDSHEFILDEYLKSNPTIIDCKDNENLFLALAALRWNLDENQLFILDRQVGGVNCGDTLYSKGSMILCTEKEWKDMDIFGDIPAHKATVQELIEHFQK